MSPRQFARPVAALCLSAALLAPTRANAQGATAGVEAGVNIANVSFDLSGASVSLDHRTGGIGGVFFGVDGKNGGLIVEVLYTQKGTTIGQSGPGFTASTKVKLDYVEIPVLARVNLKASDKVMVHLFVGPAFGIKVKDDIVDTVTENNVTTSETNDANIKGTDVGIVFGGRMDFNKFLIDARYDVGLTNVNKDTGSDEPKVKNRVFSLMFGVKFK